MGVGVGVGVGVGMGVGLDVDVGAHGQNQKPGIAGTAPYDGCTRCRCLLGRAAPAQLSTPAVCPLLSRRLKRGQGGLRSCSLLPRCYPR